MLMLMLLFVVKYFYTVVWDLSSTSTSAPKITFTNSIVIDLPKALRNILSETEELGFRYQK